MPHNPPPPPELPSRVQPTEKPITLQPLRVPTIPSPDISPVANIFASVIKGTTELTGALKEADDKVAESFHVELDINLAKATEAVAREQAAALVEGRVAKTPREVFREQFGNNRDNMNSFIRSIGRTAGSERAQQIQTEWEADKKKDYAPLFRAARLEAASLFKEDEVRQEGYIQRLAETEAALNEQMISNQLAEAKKTLIADQGIEVSSSVRNDVNKFVDENGALLLEGDQPEPFAIHQNALDAYSMLTWNKPFDELSNGLKEQAMAFVVPQMFETIANMGHIKAEDKDTILDRYDKFLKDNVDVSFELMNLLRKGRKDYDKISVASTNKVYTERRQELSSNMKLVNSVSAFRNMKAIMARSFDEDDKEAFGKLPMGMRGDGTMSYSGPIAANLMNNLEKEYQSMLKTWGRNEKIEVSITNNADPGIRPTSGANGDHDYVNQQYRQRQTEVPWENAIVDTVEHYGAAVGLTQVMIEDMNARALGPGRTEVYQSLDALQKLDPRIAHNTFLLTHLDSQLLDDWNLMRLGRMDESVVAAARENSRFAGKDYEKIETDVNARILENDLPGRDHRASKDARDLYASAYRHYRRRGYNDSDAEDAADKLYISKTIEVEAGGYKQRIVPMVVGKHPNTGEAVYVENEFGEALPAYQEVGTIVDLIKQMDRWGDNITVDLQQVRISEDGNNWVFIVLQDDPDTKGLQTANPIGEINIPRDEAGQIQLKKALNGIFTGRWEAMEALREAGPQTQEEQLKQMVGRFNPLTAFGLFNVSYDRELAKRLPKHPAFFPELRKAQGLSEFR